MKPLSSSLLLVLRLKIFLLRCMWGCGWRRTFSSSLTQNKAVKAACKWILSVCRRWRTASCTCWQTHRLQELIPLRPAAGKATPAALGVEAVQSCCSSPPLTAVQNVGAEGTELKGSGSFSCVEVDSFGLNYWWIWTVLLTRRGKGVMMENLSLSVLGEKVFSILVTKTSMYQFINVNKCSYIYK